MKVRFDNWFSAMNRNAKLGHSAKLEQLLTLSPPYDCLGLSLDGCTFSCLSTPRCLPHDGAVCT